MSGELEHELQIFLENKYLSIQLPSNNFPNNDLFR